MTRSGSCRGLTVLGILVSSFGSPLAQCVDYEDYLHWIRGVEIRGNARKIAVAGDFAYFTTGDHDEGFQILDVSDPYSPVVLGSADTGPAHGLAVSGNYVFVAGHFLFRTVDVSDPTLPVIVAFVGTPGSPRAIALSGTYAYLAAEDGGLQILDVSDPTSPTIVGAVAMPDLPGEAYGVAVDGTFAYVGTGGSLQVIDVSDATSPLVVASLEEGYYSTLAIAGQYLYATGLGLSVVDITEPTNPFLRATFDLPEWPRDVAVSGSYAYLADRTEGLQVVDVSDATDPRLVGSCGVDGFADGVALSGDFAFVATWYSGIQVAEISNPVSPPIEGHLVTGGFARAVAATGDYAYVADRDSVHVVRITDVGFPWHEGRVAMPWPGEAWSVAASGRFAYVGTVRTAGYWLDSVLHVIDATDPFAPFIAGTLGGLENVHGTTMWGDHAVIADDYEGIHVVDVSDPTSPMILGGADTPGRAWGVAVQGSRAYVADHDAGLQIVDLSDPLSPVLLGGVDTPGVARGIAVSGSFAYVADEEEGVQVIDVSDPGAPSVVTTIATPSAAHGVSVSGSYAYIADRVALQVMDVSTPTVPVFLGTVGTPGECYGTAVADTRVYVADGEQGLVIFPRQCEGPVPVLLSGLSGHVRDRAVEVTWHTSFEYLHDGFNVYRSGSLASGFSVLNERLIRGRSPYAYLDKAVGPSTTYFYKLGAVDLAGAEELHGPVAVTTPAWGIRPTLAPGAPNPFAKRTTLTFSLSKKQKAEVAVYDVAGRLVRSVVDEELPAGDHSVAWDGRDDRDQRVAGGTYFVRLQAGGVTRTRKVVFLGGK